MTDPSPAPDPDKAEPKAAPPREDKPAKPAKPAGSGQRSILARLFGISIWGALKLTLLCVVVGFFVLASQFDPRDPDVALGPAIAAMAQSTIEAAGWAIRNFWKPALAGAGIVLPVWVLWRLVILPFRK